jgi:hypothetical protein
MLVSSNGNFSFLGFPLLLLILGFSFLSSLQHSQFIPYESSMVNVRLGGIFARGKFYYGDNALDCRV